MLSFGCPNFLFCILHLVHVSKGTQALLSSWHLKYLKYIALLLMFKNIPNSRIFTASKISSDLWWVAKQTLAIGVGDRKMRVKASRYLCDISQGWSEHSQLVLGVLCAGRTAPRFLWFLTPSPGFQPSTRHWTLCASCLEEFRLRKDQPGYFPLLICAHVHTCREILSVQASWTNRASGVSSS